MPTIRQSMNPDMKGWTRATASAQPATPAVAPQQPQEGVTRSPFMLAPMPLMASTSDAFLRQFYGGTNVPKQRILPVKVGG